MSNDINTSIADIKGIRLTDSRELYASHEILPLVVIDNDIFRAVISLQGAQILEFQPKSDKPWLWLSPIARFKKGHSIRGGIPVCLPWFGVNQQDSTKPKHGFVRDREWQIASCSQNKAYTSITFVYEYDGKEPDLFEHPFLVKLNLEMSERLTLNFQLKHLGTLPAVYSWALHSYFSIDHLNSTRINGLENHPYLDNNDKLQIKTQQSSINFEYPVDAVYCNTTKSQSLLSQQCLNIEGENCPTCIVWNPNRIAAKSIDDIQDEYRHFVCIERGCAFDDKLTLAPGDTFLSSMHICKLDNKPVTNQQ